MHIRHQVFISYHHEFDQRYKDKLVELGKKSSIFLDRSVDTGDIPDSWNDDMIRKKIRDEYLKDSTVTIVLVGLETKQRKHVDWEIYSSMFDGKVNKKSGIVVINLPAISGCYCGAPYGDREENLLYPGFTSTSTRAECKRLFPYMPERIIDNLLEQDVKIYVAPWDKINEKTLQFLIDAAFESRQSNAYNLSKPMKRENS